MSSHVVHLVQEADRTRRACDGQTYMPPVTRNGDQLTLCATCAKGSPAGGAPR